MTAVILEFKRPAPKNVILCCECGREAHNRIEYVNVDQSSCQSIYKYFCDEHHMQLIQDSGLINV